MVERWDIPKGQCEFDYLPNMNVKRYMPSCCLYNNGNENEECLFVCGGYNENKSLNSCEMYNFSNGYWTTCKGMNVKRYGSGNCVWKNNKYMYGPRIIVGGGHSSKASRSVEEFDMHKQIWMSLPNTNGKHTSSPALCVCKEYGKFLSPFNGLLCIAVDM